MRPDVEVLYVCGGTTVLSEVVDETVRRRDDE